SLAASLTLLIWSLGAMTLTAMPLYPWLTRFSRYEFCSSVFPLGGILMSTCTPASFSYLCTPAAAIFQNSLALLVTKASLSELGSEALVIFTSARPSETTSIRPARDSANHFVTRIPFLLGKVSFARD